MHRAKPMPPRRFAPATGAWMRWCASACLLVVLLPGCTEKRDSRETVTFWVMGFEGQQVARLLPEFERLNPGIHVDLQQVPVLSAHEKLLTRSEEHTSELQSLMRISYAVFCLKKQTMITNNNTP